MKDGLILVVIATAIAVAIFIPGFIGHSGIGNDDLRQAPSSSTYVSEVGSPDAAAVPEHKVEPLPVQPRENVVEPERQPQLGIKSSEKPPDSPYAVITTENVSMFFYTETVEATGALLQAIDAEGYDIEWSSAATGLVEQVLAEVGIEDHTDEWVVDCHATICSVEFPNSSLREFEDGEATALLEKSTFERVIWVRRYDANSGYLFLLTPDFHYQRGSS